MGYGVYADYFHTYSSRTVSKAVQAFCYSPLKFSLCPTWMLLFSAQGVAADTNTKHTPTKKNIKQQKEGEEEVWEEGSERSKLLFISG